jgi:hypothetical protein
MSHFAVEPTTRDAEIELECQILQPAAPVKQFNLSVSSYHKPWLQRQNRVSETESQHQKKIRNISSIKLGWTHAYDGKWTMEWVICGKIIKYITLLRRHKCDTIIDLQEEALRSAE